MKGMIVPQRVLWYFSVQGKRPFTIPIPDRSYGVFLPKDRVGNPGGNIELGWKVDDGLCLIVEGN